MLPMMMIGSACLVGAGLQQGRLAAQRQTEARELNRQARHHYAANRDRLFRAHQKATQALSDLGHIRLSLLSGPIPLLLEALAPFTPTLARLEPQQWRWQPQELERLRHLSRLARRLQEQPHKWDFSRTCLVALAAFGVAVIEDAPKWQQAGRLLAEMGAKSTTVQWLGRGRLTCDETRKGKAPCQVLGRLDLGPSLAFGVLMMAAQSRRDVESAQRNFRRAERAAARMRGAANILTGIWRVAADFLRVLVYLDRHTQKLLAELPPPPTGKARPAVAESPPPPELVAAARHLWVMQGLLEAPLLTAEGALTKRFPKALDAGWAFIEAMEWHHDLPPGE